MPIEQATARKTQDFGSGFSDSSEVDRGNGEISNPGASNKICGNSSIDLKTGNFHHSQQVGSITLSYNSFDSTSGSLGVGWTHDYDIQIIENSDGSLFFRAGDGNRIWYTADGSFYRADAKSRDSSTITKGGDAPYTRTTKYGKKYNFSSSGQLTSIVDRNGNATTFTYTGGDLTGLTDHASGRTISITTEEGKIRYITEPVTDSSSRTYTISYWPSGRISSISDPYGNVWHYRYGPNNDQKMSQKIDPSGNVTTYNYHGGGKLKDSTDPNGIMKTIAYEPATSTTTVTEKDGSIWTHKYHAGLNVPLEITDPLGNKTTYAYDFSKTTFFP
ncbi:MAG: DUF6531 domain-containing protein [Anaerolineaceae bacterium]